MTPKRFVYILNSHSDPTRYYTGIAGNVRRRLEEHNAGGYRYHIAGGRGAWSS
jgi:predicted GIY-YIG superfamily endonuclease